ncbi:hypothetical protein RhiirA4_166879 [Rhizophagus irregularis]|uniref:Uncharacterized protein n=1 Tax=Rhizophagus irregularis TaxID=588596 RepID=A0A2I1GFG4_9GLOM|nr:hypothetical protein RhiirA4_166879 [Rhizophagus irregularis]
MSEIENCSKFLYPYINPIFCKRGDILQSYVMDLRFDGLYRSWPFLPSRLVIDEPSLP